VVALNICVEIKRVGGLPPPDGITASRGGGLKLAIKKRRNLRFEPDDKPHACTEQEDVAQ